MSGCLLSAVLSNYSQAAGWPPPNFPQPPHWRRSRSSTSIRFRRSTSSRSVRASRRVLEVVDERLK